MNKSDFVLQGYEDMEISTQIIVREALQRNVEVEILNRKSHFIKLSKESHVEYIKEASKTSKDSYITFLMMEDKEVSKFMLNNAGIRVPHGKLLSSKKEALAYINTLQYRSIVIKPNSTNFGIGVHVFEKPASPLQIQGAVEDAFSHDESIIVEEFIPGREYRFLIIGDTCVAVCNRVPANVTGDGKKNIEELIFQKNKDVRRGRGHITPLEIIDIDSTVLDYLQRQNISLDSIPFQGQKIFLRQNSNISTGGDSIDITDDVHLDYLEIAQQSALCVQASVCGVDIMIHNPSESPHNNNHAVIEINFNPVLYIHEFPFQGQKRSIGKHMLDLLGFA